MNKRIILVMIILAIGIITPPSFPAHALVIVDDAKRRVKIPVGSQRIVVLNSSNLELLYAVGGQAIARPEFSGMPGYLVEKVRDLPSVGETPNPNVERIVSLAPELVIGVNATFHHQIVPTLERAGISVLLLSIASYTDILEKVKVYGTITGRSEKAKSLIGEIEKKIHDIKSRIKRSHFLPPPKVVILWGSTQSFTMALPSSFVGNIVELVGGENIAKNIKPLATMPQYAALSPEFVLAKNPEVMLVITHGYDDKVKDKFQREILAHPAWRGLRPIKEGRLHLLPYELFGVNPTIRVPAAVDHVARLLYPEVFK